MSFILPTITTQRLILRSFCENDTDAVYSAFSHAVFTEQMLTDAQPDRFFAESYIAEIVNKNDSSCTWAVTEKGKELCIGAVSLSSPENMSTEIGYWIADEYKSNGYATEAVYAAVRYAFEYMKLHRVYAKCRTDNKASVHVLKKNGFSIEGIAKDAVYRHGEYISIAYFAKINNRQ